MYKYFIVDTSGSQPFLAYVDCRDVLEVWSLPTGPDQGVVLNFIFNSLDLPFQGIGVSVGPGDFLQLEWELLCSRALWLKMSL